jgi:hypothetical protein
MACRATNVEAKPVMWSNGWLTHISSRPMCVMNDTPHKTGHQKAAQSGALCVSVDSLPIKHPFEQRSGSHAIASFGRNNRNYLRCLHDDLTRFSASQTISNSLQRHILQLVRIDRGAHFEFGTNLALNLYDRSH